MSELAQDKGQFPHDGRMPASGPATVLAIEKFVGNITGPANLAATYTNQCAIAANKLEGFTSNRPAGADPLGPAPADPSCYVLVSTSRSLAIIWPTRRSSGPASAMQRAGAGSRSTSV